jgi:hypothetical protein
VSFRNTGTKVEHYSGSVCAFVWPAPTTARRKEQRSDYETAVKCSFTLHSLRLAQLKKIRTNWRDNIFEEGSEFLMVGMKVQWNEGGGRILLGDNSGGGADKLWPVRRHCVGAWQGLGLVAQCLGSAHVRAFFLLCHWDVTQHISGFLGAFFCRENIIRNYVTWSNILNWLQTCGASCVWRIDEWVMVCLCVWCYGVPVCMVLWCACVMVCLCVWCYEFVWYTSLVNWCWVGHRKQTQTWFSWGILNVFFPETVRENTH